MITASGSAGSLLAIAAGANDFLNKPVDFQDVRLRGRQRHLHNSLFQQLRVEREKSSTCWQTFSQANR